jgi:outer membrane lipoprotein-sorting protein
MLLLVLGLTSTGCAPKEQPETLPHYPLSDATETLHQLADRAKRVHSLNAQGLITLTKPDGDSVRLDGLIVMAPPDRSRLRATKFDRVVFDLTVTPDGVWMIAPDDPKRKEQIQKAGAGAAKLAKTWSLLTGGFFDSPNLHAEEHGDRLTVRRQTPGEPTVICDVDRPTLTPRRYSLLDDHGVQRFSMTLDHYRQFGDIAWPMRLTAVSEGGTVVVELRDVEVNPELPTGAFTPPRRAERLP